MPLLSPESEDRMGIDAQEPNYLCPTIERLTEALRGPRDEYTYSVSLSLLEQLREEAVQFRAWGHALKDRIRALQIKIDDITGRE